MTKYISSLTKFAEFAKKLFHSYLIQATQFAKQPLDLTFFKHVLL